MDGNVLPFPGDRVPILGERKLEVPRSAHKTVFAGCSLGFSVVMDENRIVLRYLLSIQDPAENKVYEFRFDEDYREAMANFFEQAPHVGEQVSEDVPTQ